MKVKNFVTFAWRHTLVLSTTRVVSTVCGWRIQILNLNWWDAHNITRLMRHLGVIHLVNLGCLEVTLTHWSKDHLVSVDRMPSCVFTLKRQAIDMILLWLRNVLDLACELAYFGFKNIVICDHFDALRLTFPARTSLRVYRVTGLLVLHTLMIFFVLRYVYKL